MEGYIQFKIEKVFGFYYVSGQNEKKAFMYLDKNGRQDSFNKEIYATLEDAQAAVSKFSEEYQVWAIQPAKAEAKSTKGK
jgi:hypothetical protein